MLNKTWKSVVILAMMFGIFGYLAPETEANGTIKIMMNGNIVETEVPPMIAGDRVMVPVRAVAEALDLDVRWDAEHQAVMIGGTPEIVTGVRTSTSVIRLYVNLERVETDVAPAIVQSRVMVPLRVIAEHLGLDVAWNEGERTVYVAKIDQSMKDHLNSEDLNEARSAALTLPQTRYCQL
ncbi:copper amine oxidase N-terminal domain-containing protein [Paenibacillus sp. 1P07SE]|uniref:copper amine oxidase N-terminal domain-containing protein n=1 Tax=Paenibacillus sp. 1P07SE TaxID=3132209 RepID=UPI0039A5B668